MRLQAELRVGSRGVCVALSLAATLCSFACSPGSARRQRGNDLPLVIAASESLTLALADSIATARGLINPAAVAGLESLTACDDRVDASNWPHYRTPIVEMMVPPGFTQSSDGFSGRAEWRGPDGWIRAVGSSSQLHTGWTGLITSECDLYVAGWPTHLDLVNTTYGKGVHAMIMVAGKQAISIEAQAKSVARQAQMLHAIRSARVSASW
jgi:hypothetical protein